jgi:nucleoside-diphosphate-sugar epimerase
MLGGRSEHIIPNPRGDFEEWRKAADFTRAKKILGWKPSIFIKQGMGML